ncbi:MAG: diacylglycerol/lipid kinase family protein, partial [Acholeplasmataceae bacterium]
SGNTVKSHSLLSITDVDRFIAECQPDDRVIIVGGDGTMNHLVNRIYGKQIEQPIYIYRAGTGNDFVRSLRTKSRLVPIKEYIQRLPTVRYGNDSRLFLNGAGFGLDGYVAQLVNTSKFTKSKFNFFRHTLEGFIKFRPIELEITVDGRHFKEKRVWFASVMNGAYFGGGMKVAPRAKRSDDSLQLVVIRNMPKWLLFLIFPTIYLGWHTIFRSFVSIHQGKRITLKSSEGTHMQIDGDVEYPVYEMTADAVE